MSEVPGMTEGIEALRILFQGTEMLFRTSGNFAKWSMESLVKFGTFMYRQTKTKKDGLKPGEIQFSDLMKKGELSIMQINNSNMEQFIAYAKQAGLTYAIMPDLNKSDDFFEVAFLEKQGTAARYYIAQNPDTAKSYTFVEYQNNATTEEIERTLEKIDNDVQVQLDTMSYSDVIKQGGLSLELDSSFFVLDNVSESDKIKVGVPNEKNQYIELPKKRISKQQESDKLLIGLLPDEQFIVLDKNGNASAKKISSKELADKVKNMKIINKKDPNVKQVKIVNKSKDGTVSSLTRKIVNDDNAMKKISSPVKITGKKR